MKDLITIEEVCRLAQVSKPTVYRKVKVGEFPSPVKVPTTASRGPKMVNRWERGAILAWCFKKNAERPQSMLQSKRPTSIGTRTTSHGTSSISSSCKPLLADYLQLSRSRYLDEGRSQR